MKTQQVNPSSLLFDGINRNSRNVDIGLMVLRAGAGPAHCAIFEKILPRDGVWGPQAWMLACRCLK